MTAYGAGDWVRSIDARVARLIDFGRAREAYEFLKKTTKLVAEEVARRSVHFDDLMKQVEAAQREEADKSGLTAVLEEGKALGARRDDLVQEVEKLRQGIQEYQKQLADLDRTPDEYYDEAIKKFQRFLGEAKLALLQRHARETPDRQDDAIVSELSGVDRQIEELRPNAAEQAEHRKDADRVREGLDLVARRYRQENFDS
jgi:uncharacterized coiled-coil DUF342 family protein